MKTRHGRICVIGSGYVGTVVAAGLAHIGHDVIGVESDVYKLGQLQVGIAPFHESGLNDLLAEGLTSGRLSFRADIGGAMAETEIVYICVGTPQILERRTRYDGRHQRRSRGRSACQRARSCQQIHCAGRVGAVALVSG